MIISLKISTSHWMLSRYIKIPSPCALMIIKILNVIEFFQLVTTRWNNFPTYKINLLSSYFECNENNFETWLEVTSFGEPARMNMTKPLLSPQPPDSSQLQTKASRSSPTHIVISFFLTASPDETLLLKSMAKEKCARKFNIYFLPSNSCSAKSSLIEEENMARASDIERDEKYWNILFWLKKGETEKFNLKFFE